ncbi:MAG: HAD family hydrolase [Planctomycetota bacterium]
MKKPAVFLDRDGTIIENSGYLADPSEVRLLPGAADAIRRLHRGGFLVVVVSNQSGVARGLLTERQLWSVHDRLVELLEQYGARLDAAYYCPFLFGPEAKVEAYRRDSDLRKPAPGMLVQASREHDIDLSASWMIGDSLSDVEAGTQAGCRTILLANGRAKTTTLGAVPNRTASTLAEASDLLLSENPSTDVEPSGASDEATQSRPVPRPLPGMSGLGDVEIAQTLRDVAQHLDRATRRTRQHDFSLLRLFAALLQMFAVVAGVWGIGALLGDRNDAAGARLALACFFQLASLSAFAIDRFR